MSHSDQSQWQWKGAAFWYITTEPPPATSHPPSTPGTQPHTHLPPPSHGSAAFWMQINPHWGKKGLKEPCFGPPSNKCLMQKQKKKYSLFLSKSNIYIFEGRRHSQGSTCRQTDNCRMRGQETGDGNVLDCGCAELCSVVLRDKLMWIYIALFFYRTNERAGHGRG